MADVQRQTGRRLCRWSVRAAFLLLAANAGCGPGGPIHVALHSEVLRPQPGVVLFIADGLSVDLLRQGCREGWLPNIQHRFVEGGTHVEHAVSGLPCITYSILTTFATGVSPARHGIVGNEWFDRQARLHRDYAFIKHYRAVNDDFDLPTIYELINPAASGSIQIAVKRGVSKNFANWALSGTMWFFHDYTAVDKLAATTLERVARWANGRRCWPTVLTCYFPGLDTIGHNFGVNSERYRWSVAHLDHQIGRVCDWLEREGLLETTYLTLVSDHGLVPVEPDGVIDLLPYLRDTLGRNVTSGPMQDGSFDHRRRYLDRFDTVYVKSAMRFATIHLAGDEGWDSRAEPVTVESTLASAPEGARLWEIPGIDLVAYATSDNEVVLRSPRGAARIEQREGGTGPEFRYVPVPDDVFGYMADSELAAFVAAGFHDTRAWLTATIEQTYTGVIPQLGPLLRCPRIGEVVLFAAYGYSFGNERSGHGGIRREEMRIPLMFAGPGIQPGGTIPQARAVDLVPTLLALLGEEAPQGASLEGRPLLDQRLTTVK